MKLAPEDLHKTFRIKLSIYDTMSFYVYRYTKVQDIKRHKSNGRITVEVKQTSNYLGFLRYYLHFWVSRRKDVRCANDTAPFWHRIPIFTQILVRWNYEEKGYKEREEKKERKVSQSVKFCYKRLRNCFPSFIKLLLNRLKIPFNENVNLVSNMLYLIRCRT